MSELVLVSIYKDVYGVMSLTPQKTSFFHHIRRSHLRKNIDGWELLDPHTPPCARPTQTRVPAEICPSLKRRIEPNSKSHSAARCSTFTRARSHNLWLCCGSSVNCFNVRSITTVSRERPVQFLPLKSTSKPKPPVKSLLWITDLHQPSFAKT